MEYFSREQIIHELQEPFQSYIEKFNVDDIGIFEEEGQDDHYYMGYTVTKGDKTYHIHMPFAKNHEGNLCPLKNEWTVESDEPQGDDHHGYKNIESAFNHL